MSQNKKDISDKEKPNGGNCIMQKFAFVDWKQSIIMKICKIYNKQVDALTIKLYMVNKWRLLKNA
jgi:hypothetical protein